MLNLEPETYRDAQAEVTNILGQVLPVYALKFSGGLRTGMIGTTILWMEYFRFRTEKRPVSDPGGGTSEVHLLTARLSPQNGSGLFGEEVDFDLETSLELARFLFPHHTWEVAGPKELAAEKVRILLEEIDSSIAMNDVLGRNLDRPRCSSVYRRQLAEIEELKAEVAQITGFKKEQVDLMLELSYEDLTSVELLKTMETLVAELA